jgi:TIR domain/Pentapeptide repeats (8 copies)
MANDEHVAMLKKGVHAWNEWRQNQSVRPDLSGANLTRADLKGAYLNKANLINADLSYADLVGAKVIDVDLTNAKLTRADLSNANLMATELPGATLAGACLRSADLSYANLSRANLINANLNSANLTLADLLNADLSDADLGEAMLIGTNLAGANLTGAFLVDTVFAATALNAEGLGHCRHSAPSYIDFQTLEKSGPLPIAFLRGVGLPDRLIEYLPSLLNQPIQHYSCFISYSSKDDGFAQRLHADLQNQGVRCWFAPHDVRMGGKIIDAIDEAIRLRDKVLLILSEGAIASGWVEGEVTRALDEERTRKQLVLVPVRLDDAVMQSSEGWAHLLRGQRNIGDFTGWKDHDSYQKSFDRLMRDLTVKQESTVTQPGSPHF